MIYITGDMHGDINRFKSRAMKRLKRGDFLIVCGDFGFVWEGGKKERKQLAWIAKRRFTTLFLDGVHENRALLNAFPQSEMFGGEVRRLGERLFWLQRGQVFVIDNKRIFAMGGGESEDSAADAAPDAAWSEDLPTTQEIVSAARRLAEANYAVDYVVTYEAATTIKNAMNIRQDTINPLNAFLDRVLRQCTFRKWFFGCYHIDRKISHAHRAMFRDVVPVDE
ncbi:MAG: metallophosphoesterase [Acetanaerobacterium sp.]